VQCSYFQSTELLARCIAATAAMLGTAWPSPPSGIGGTACSSRLSGACKVHAHD
jgi:hypothetical protein